MKSFIKRDSYIESQGVGGRETSRLKVTPNDIASEHTVGTNNFLSGGHGGNQTGEGTCMGMCMDNFLSVPPLKCNTFF